MDRPTFFRRMRDLLVQTPQGERRIVALAGAPASGKSTLAQDAVDVLNRSEPGAAALVGMDGFHYDDEVLVPHGWRPRKGAPHTFDLGGLGATLRRLRANEEPWVTVPRFDREIEIARAGAVMIEREVRIVVVEGNYLLLDDEPWPDIARNFDLTVMLHVDEGQLSERLTARWSEHGFDETIAQSRVQVNDLPNARLVHARSRKADWNVED